MGFGAGGGRRRSRGASQPTSKLGGATEALVAVAVPLTMYRRSSGHRVLVCMQPYIDDRVDLLNRDNGFVGLVEKGEVEEGL